MSVELLLRWNVSYHNAFVSSDGIRREISPSGPCWFVSFFRVGFFLVFAEFPLLTGR